MAIHNPPKYRYSLFEEWDKVAFEQIKVIGKNKNYPKILGSDKNINDFLVTLIRTQKSLHDWRDLLKDTLAQVADNNRIDSVSLYQKYPPESIGAEAPEWVTYEEDKIVNDFIDELATRPIEFEGSNKEISEFIIRFILGQLSHDWEWTIMMVWEMLGDTNKLSVKDLNYEMKGFDYMNLFE